MDFQNPQQPNNEPMAGGNPEPTPNENMGAGMGEKPMQAAPEMPANEAPATPPVGEQPIMGGMATGEAGQNMSENMQSSPLFTDEPVKKSNSAVIILVVVIVLVIAAGVIFFMMAKNPNMNSGPVVDGQPVDNTGVVDNQQTGSAFGQQQQSNRELNSGNDIASELSEINSELEQLDIDSFEEEFSEIDKILDDIRL